MKTAIVTGITGQDGAYLAQYLLNKNVRVIGAFRRGAERTSWRLKYLGIDKDIEPLEFELSEFAQIFKAIKDIKPDYFYNLGAMSFVGTSFDQPLYTQEVNYLGALRVLESIRLAELETRFYQASTSEMFGEVKTIPQNELTPFHPRSPYGVSKLAAHWASINYRESYGMHCSNGILFNHESPLRGDEFVTKKIVSCFFQISQNNIYFFELGNLDAKRDWGYAKDYVEGMEMITNLDKPDDFVIATNKTNTIRYFCELAANEFGYNIAWKGQGVEEIGFDSKTNKTLIRVNPKFYRPAEVDILIGCYDKIKKVAGWKPKTSLEDLVSLMCSEEIKLNNFFNTNKVN